MGKRIVTDPFRVEFVNWVDSLKEWEWYFTGTFKYECGMEPAKRAFKRFVRYEHTHRLKWFSLRKNRLNTHFTSPFLRLVFHFLPNRLNTHFT